jgi:hypothetical protein
MREAERGRQVGRARGSHCGDAECLKQQMTGTRLAALLALHAQAITRYHFGKVIRRQP